MTEARIIQLPIGPMMNYAYLIGDENTSSCAAVDPSWDANAIKLAAKDAGWKIEKILLTHTHFDHANALEALASATGAKVYVHREELGEIPRGIDAHATEDGTIIEIGSVKIECLHTPGHTPGSQCFMVGKALISGDTLFVDGCGRVDLPGSDPKKMLNSLKRLAALNSDIIIYPGHDYGSSPTSTIGNQRGQNPCLSAESERMLL